MDMRLVGTRRAVIAIAAVAGLGVMSLAGAPVRRSGGNA